MILRRCLGPAVRRGSEAPHGGAGGRNALPRHGGTDQAGDQVGGLGMVGW